jgi:Holliday junction resolvase RusA-like endonuclease
MSEPLTSYRIDVEIIFGAQNRNLRADVDNVAKLILDGPRGILYQDDRQVRSVRVVALPGDDAVKVRGLSQHI